MPVSQNSASSDVQNNMMFMNEPNSNYCPVETSQCDWIPEYESTYDCDE